MSENSNTKIWTILEILKWTTDYFQSKTIESPRLKAELLLCHLLSLKRIELYSNYDKPLSASELVKFKEWVVKASKHEPIQMIIGEVYFCG